MNAFLLAISYNPEKPFETKMTVTPVGEADGANIEDVAEALRIMRDRILIEKGMQLALANSSPDRELNHETAV